MFELTAEFLAREIAHYEHIPYAEALEVMQYVESTGYPKDHWLQALMMGGWATIYLNAWMYKTFLGKPAGGSFPE